VSEFLSNVCKYTDRVAIFFFLFLREVRTLVDTLAVINTCAYNG